MNFVLEMNSCGILEICLRQLKCLRAWEQSEAGLRNEMNFVLEMNSYGILEICLRQLKCLRAWEQSEAGLRSYDCPRASYEL